ncbi:AMP-dependent synthetase and ligase [Pseudooceanicola batsensis HTCC2597]|uniref:AMP-dependent synthetase and ligase n=1 Tax=Pseudooceanicola batsensis (strain ATCC BAA-863 / DSM 15984 / KCTC 12145 / HTCC2597) TaxID=252305 RepID=A3TSX9_PSEBH|nr:AMP-binding protein [Pseudooceanicola batsensis]EAQ04756.1 AMP-dependent synthetase and ligase [Pseudooceanicola batsensis HTCC2597]
MEAALDRDSAVLRYMLERHAEARGDETFVHFHGGPEWTYRTVLDRVRRRAATLRDEGVRQGDPVLTFLGNGPDLLVTWFAINYLGAVYVPLNTALLGGSLQHILTDSGARVMVAAPSLAARLEGINRGALGTVLLVEEGETPEIPGLDLRRLSDPEQAEPVETDRPIEPWDTQAIMYTSGTTGQAKGVLSSYTQLYTMGPDAFDCVGPQDRCMICGPIFHCGSTLYVYAMLARGLSIGMMAEFKTDQFWPAVRETGSTYTLLLGVMAAFLLKAPVTAQDREHPLTHVFIVPFGEDGPAFAERFGVDVYTVYNMTEISSPIHAGPGITEKGLAGRLRPWMEARVVDANDIEVPPGEVGELILRSSRPWALMKGYLNRPDATAEAMRNGWFHTGDSFRQDKDGRFYFVDRAKDVIRRRGENISSFALEGEVLGHEAVRECAAVAVPSEHTEDEVLIVVTPVEGRRIDPADLVEWLAGRVPRFMVPRYVRVMEELPKTASGKIQKHVMRSEGVTADTWQRAGR